jgi:putative transcriptional regulator
MGKSNPNRLRVLRAERRMTQLSLAAKAGINVARISFIENGHVEPKPEERDRIARAFEVPVSNVFPAAEAVAS